MPNTHKVNPGGFPKAKLASGVAATPKSIDMGEFLNTMKPKSIMTTNTRTTKGAIVISEPIMVETPRPP
jgi:hypothetical protein